MKNHFCLMEKSWISYEGECNWCGEKELVKQSKPYKEISEYLHKATDGRVRIDPVTGDFGVGVLVQPEQEPVAWAQFSEAGNLIDLLEEPCGGYVPLYTTPPQRTWVGLTDGERQKIHFMWAGTEELTDEQEVINLVEDWLKEKNT